jgi:hypothetical protein
MASPLRVKNTASFDIAAYPLLLVPRVLGDDHPDALWSMNSLAEIRRALGDLQGAHDLHEQTLSARRRVLGNDHPDTLSSMEKLAVVRRKLEGQEAELDSR